MMARLEDLEARVAKVERLVEEQELEEAAALGFRPRSDQALDGYREPTRRVSRVQLEPGASPSVKPGNQVLLERLRTKTSRLTAWEQAAALKGTGT